MQNISEQAKVSVLWMSIASRLKKTQRLAELNEDYDCWDKFRDNVLDAWEEIIPDVYLNQKDAWIPDWNVGCPDQEFADELLLNEVGEWVAIMKVYAETVQRLKKEFVHKKNREQLSQIDKLATLVVESNNALFETCFIE